MNRGMSALSFQIARACLRRRVMVLSDLVGYEKHGRRPDAQACPDLDIALDIAAGGTVASHRVHSASARTLRAEAMSNQESSRWRACRETQKCT
jgi:hypothetical protein